MVISMVVAIGLIPLWPVFSTSETATEKLWAPQASRGVSDQKLFIQDYGTAIRREQIIVTHKKGRSCCRTEACIKSCRKSGPDQRWCFEGEGDAGQK